MSAWSAELSESATDPSAGVWVILESVHAVAEDWEKPFTIEVEEQAAFRAALPEDMPWRPGVLAALPHDAQVRAAVALNGLLPAGDALRFCRMDACHMQALSAARPSAVADLNSQLDAQMAAFGISPAVDGLTDLELMAAMKQLECATGMAALDTKGRCVTFCLPRSSSDLMFIAITACTSERLLCSKSVIVPHVLCAQGCSHSSLVRAVTDSAGRCRGHATGPPAARVQCHTEPEVNGYGRTNHSAGGCFQRGFQAKHDGTAAQKQQQCSQKVPYQILFG